MRCLPSHKTSGRLSKWSGSRFKTTTGKNFSIQSVTKSDSLLLYNTVELKRQMFLSRDYTNERRIAVAVKHNNFLSSFCLKGACPLPAESCPRKDTLSALFQCFRRPSVSSDCGEQDTRLNGSLHWSCTAVQMVDSFLSARLGVRNQGQGLCLGMKAYSCLSPSSLGVKSDS